MTSRIASLLLLLVLVFSSCAPPWRGEEDNYPIVVLSFADSTTHLKQPLDSVGVTRLLNIDRNQELPIDSAFTRPLMNFDSRVDPQYDLLLPLDKARDSVRFAIFFGAASDTLSIRYQRSHGENDRGDYDVNFVWSSFNLSHSFDSLSSANHEDNYHPRVELWLEVVQ